MAYKTSRFISVILWCDRRVVGRTTVNLLLQSRCTADKADYANLAVLRPNSHNALLSASLP